MAKIKYCFDEKPPYRMVADLWSKSFGRNLDIKYWEWRFENNPNDKKSYAVYIIDDAKMVAYYALCPTILYVDGEAFRSALMNMAMTHPDFKRKGYFVEIEIALHEVMKSEGYHMVFGFANHQAHRLHRKHAGWRDLAILNIMRCTKEHFRGLSVKNYRDLSFDSGKISKEAIKKTECMDFTNNRIWFSRDCKNLIWRLYDNPVYDYYHITIKKGEMTAGVVFFKYYRGSVDVMEFFYDITIQQSELFGAGLRKIFEESNVKDISLWSNLHTEEHLYLEKLGFVEAEFNTYFGVIPFTSSKEVLDYKNWHYRYLDSDVF